MMVWLQIQVGCCWHGRVQNDPFTRGYVGMLADKLVIVAIRQSMV